MPEVVLLSVCKNLLFTLLNLVDPQELLILKLGMMEVKSLVLNNK
jgi:hypothetical protein